MGGITLDFNVMGGRFSKEKAETHVEALSKKGILTLPEVLVIEVLGDPRFLNVILKLVRGPRAALDLVDNVIYFITNGKLSKIKVPRSTAYRILKRLRELGLIEVHVAIDKRKKYYALTDLGKLVADRVMKLIKKKLKPHLERIRDRENERYYGLPLRDFSVLIMREFNIDPLIFIEAFNVIKVKRPLETYLALKY